MADFIVERCATEVLYTWKLWRRENIANYCLRTISVLDEIASFDGFPAVYGMPIYWDYIA